MEIKDLKCGDFIGTKTGEIMQVNLLNEKEFQFQMYHPKTKERSDFCLEGESANLEGFFKATGAQKIDRPT